MKSSGIVRGMMMCLAALGVCLSGAAMAAPPTPEPAVHDVALADGGVFAGLNRERGRPYANGWARSGFCTGGFWE